MDLTQPLHLITSTACGFRGCPNPIPENSPFKMCETCRIVFVTERTALMTTPFEPRADHIKHKFIGEQIINLTAAEVLEMQSQLQFLYLEYSKIIKLHGLEPTSKRAKLSLEEQIEEAREQNRNVETRSSKNVKAQKEKLSKLQKQMKALGCNDPSGKKGTCPDCTHEAEAKRIFNDVAPDGDLGF